MNLSAIGALWRVFRAGEAVANPVAWKQGQITVNALVALLAAVAAAAKGFGYDLQITDDQMAAIAGGVLAAVNWVCTVVSTDKVGLTGAAASAAPEPATPDAPARAERVDTTRMGPAALARPPGQQAAPTGGPAAPAPQQQRPDPDRPEPFSAA